MRWRWVLGAAALAGAAIASAVVVRERRRVADLDPVEIRRRLRRRHGDAVAAGRADCSDDGIDAVEDALRRGDWRAADDATRRLIVHSIDDPGGLSEDTIDRLDARLLGVLDDVWCSHSGDRFGLRPQLRVIDGGPDDRSWRGNAASLGWVEPDLGWLRHAEIDGTSESLGRFPWTAGWLGASAAVAPAAALTQLYELARRALPADR